MSARHLGITVAVLVVGAARPASAQRADSAAPAPRADTIGTLACPRAGALARLWSGTAGDSARRARGGTPPADLVAERRVIDTAITLNIGDRSWQRDSMAAGVALGVAGNAGARSAPWHACAGATATFGRITATLHNVHGQIHLRADPGALDAIGGTARRTTPPAPPRR